MKQREFYVRRRRDNKFVTVYFCATLKRARFLFSACYSPDLFYLSDRKGKTL